MLPVVARGPTPPARRGPDGRHAGLRCRCAMVVVL